MTVETIAWICIGLSALAFVFTFLNTLAFNPPAECLTKKTLPPLSVLIPARNEAGSIEHLLTTLLQSDHPNLEILVLDDNSEDSTAQIIDGFAEKHSNVKRITGSPLDPGWNGKQFACWQLAQAAEHEYFVFLDADVRLRSNCLSAAHNQLLRQNLPLLSGFPHQITKTWMESALIPMINFILLAYLPFILMRLTRVTGASAGCGQFFITTRDAYTKAGGHRAIQSSAHDGVTLPRSYRAAGLKTDVCDLSNHASVRMYHSTSEVWNGLKKNATEGIGAKASIIPMTILLVFAHVLPWFLLISSDSDVVTLALCAIAISYTSRLLASIPYNLSLWGAALHPVGTAILVFIQWWAWVEKKKGRKTQWKGRPV